MDEQPKEEPKPRLHAIDAGDLTRMNVPEEFWTAGAAGFSGLTPTVKPVIRNYVANFDEMLKKGVGLMLLGDPGVGKTATAVTLLKHARERFLTGYFIRIAELREALREQQSFDADLSIMDRCRAVDFLVLDDFGETDLLAPWFKLGDLSELVVARGQRRRPTIVTSGLGKSIFMSAKPGFFDTIGTYTPDFLIVGSDRREERRKELRKRLTKQDEGT